MDSRIPEYGKLLKVNRLGFSVLAFLFASAFLASAETKAETGIRFDTPLQHESHISVRSDAGAVSIGSAQPWWKSMMAQVPSIFRFQREESERVIVDRRYLRFDMRSDSQRSLKRVHLGKRPVPTTVGISMRWVLGGDANPDTGLLVAVE